MVRTPRAAPVPRVIRSRRDDRYDAGRSAPPKRAESGYVVSVQDDTDTVTVTLKDAGDNPVSGKTVTLDQGSGHSTIGAASGTSET